MKKPQIALKTRDQGVEKIKIQSRPGHYKSYKSVLMPLLKPQYKKSASNSANAYTEPQIHIAGGDINKHWYIHYYFMDPSINQDPVRIRVKYTINKYKTYEERLKQAKQVQKVIRQMLLEGYNPLQPNSIVKKEIDIIELLYQKSKEFKRKKTQSDYQSSLKQFKHYYEQISPLPNYRAMDRKYILSFRRWLDNGKRSNKTINNIIEGLRSLFNKLIDEEIIDYTPFVNIKNLPHTPAPKYGWTVEEINKLRILQSTNPGLWLICQLIYYCGLRPIEITRLQVKDINIEQSNIYFPGTKSKNGKSKFIALPSSLATTLKIFIDTHDKESYIISRGLNPGAIHLSRNVISSSFKKIIKKKLGINKNLYWLKDTAIQRLLESGANSKQVQYHFRHHSLEMTDKYATTFTNDKNFINHYPEL